MTDNELGSIEGGSGERRRNGLFAFLEMRELSSGKPDQRVKKGPLSGNGTRAGTGTRTTCLSIATTADHE
jgi:hypothetical protein